MTIRQTLNGKTIPFRLCLTNESGYYLDINLYREVSDPKTGLIKFESFGSKQGPLHGLPVSTPYMTKDYLQQKRFQAQSNGTTYVYDFPDMFRQVLDRIWKEYAASRSKAAAVEIPPSSPLEFIELVLNAHDQLEEQKRLPGENDVGMVAWRMKFYTPEYPNGREVIVIANDITFRIGSFAVREDLLFLRASELARKLRIPRIYLAANSGARLGLAEEVKHLFRIAWVDENEPDKGFSYIYLTPEDYSKVSNLGSVRATLIEDNGESRYKITDIIGNLSFPLWATASCDFCHRL